MTIAALSLSHQSTPLDLRGRLSVASEQMATALADLRSRLCPVAEEAALLSTCNRTELYVVGHGADSGVMERALQWLAERGDVGMGTLAQHAHLRQGPEAARHVFRVASGLDSMVLGEPQILGQLKSAARQAAQAGTLGSTLHQLFQRSFTVAKEVRTRTEIGSHSVSMAAAAARLADELFEDLHALQVLFVGAGEMIELVATHFAARKPAGMALANRRLERAEALAARLGAQTLALADLPAQLHRFDVVVSCTASTLPLIGLGAVERALRQRRSRPMLLVDLAVPRDIEPEVAGLPDAYLYTVDDLAERVRVAGARRQSAVQQAEAIVDAGVLGFEQWRAQRANVPLIQALHQRAEDWQQAEVRRASRMIARGEPLDEVLQALASGLAHKMLHGTLRALQDARDDGQRQDLAHTAARLWLQEPHARPRSPLP